MDKKVEKPKAVKRAAKEKEYEGTGKVDVQLLSPRQFTLEEVINKIEITPEMAILLPRRKPGEFKGNPARCEYCGGSMTKGTCGRCGKVMP